MPELPEVETLCRQLNEVLTGEMVVAVEVLDPLLGQDPALTGKRVERVCRRGKYIQIEMVDGPPLVLHLRMTGRLLWLTSGDPVPPHTRMVLSFTHGKIMLVDPRRFATLCVQEKAAIPPALPNPLEGLPARRLRELAGRRRLPVKSFLMDQRCIAGIGNIYACEILHHAAVDPRRPAGSLTLAEWRKVEKAAALVLPRAVACRGTTVSDWRDLFDRCGTNQDHLEVYSLSGERCRRCGDRIERITIAGRGTFFCPHCQK